MINARNCHLCREMDNFIQRELDKVVWEFDEKEIIARIDIEIESIF